MLTLPRAEVQQAAFDPPSGSGRNYISADGLRVEPGGAIEPDPLQMGYRPRHIDEIASNKPRATL